MRRRENQVPCRAVVKAWLGRGGLAAWGVALSLPLDSFASKAFESSFQFVVEAALANLQLAALLCRL